MAEKLQLENATVEILSVNPRSEFHGDDRVLACDVKFKMTASKKIVDALTGGQAIPWWANDANKTAKIPGLEVKVPVVFEEHEVVLREEIGSDPPLLELELATLAKWKVAPENHAEAQVHGAIQFEASGQDIAIVAQCIGDNLILSCSPRQASLDLDGDEDQIEKGPQNEVA